MRRVLPIAVPSLVGVLLAGATGGKVPSTIALGLVLVAANVAVVRLRVATLRPSDSDGTELALPMAIAWTAFAGWAAWVDFHPGSWAHWGLVVTSLYLLFAGITQQILPERQ